jgi:type I restriction enzyme R subunit
VIYACHDVASVEAGSRLPSSLHSPGRITKARLRGAFPLLREQEFCYFCRFMPIEAEWLTRKSRIDSRLTQKGWQLVRFSPSLDLKALDKTAVEELPTANGPADYALFVKGDLLGIVEAKKITVNPQNVLEQAKRYARGVFDAVGQWNGFRVPFLYSSNGTLIWHLDTRPSKHVSRQLSDFHTPEALEERFADDTDKARNYYSIPRRNK